MNNISNYKDAVSYITSIPRFVNGNEFDNLKDFYNKKYGDDRMRYGDNTKIFHVAGTNGKGSVCAFLASIGNAMGRSTGVFTSPHLVDMRERIAVNGSMVSEEEFYLAFTKVWDKLADYNNERVEQFLPTYFTWTYLIAVEVFTVTKPDIIIWETGLGGKYDATNVSDCKSVAIITEIGLDHMEYLGDTKEQIALEKAGIMRAGISVVIPDRDTKVTSLLAKAADATGAIILPVPGLHNIKVEVDSKGIDFSYNSRYYKNANFTLGTLAVYQAENATLALTAMECVYGSDELSMDDMQLGIASMKWPGRMEEIKPGVVFDGAHNVDGIEAMLSSVSNDDCRGRRYLLFSAVADKQADIMIDMIDRSKLFDLIAVAHIDNSRGISTRALKDLVKGIGNSRVYEDVRTAYEALLSYKKEVDKVYVCGSLYLVGELKEWMC